ncbi:MAG: serine/threonine protein kinase, partial [Planctomycetaceae bacterium]
MTSPIRIGVILQSGFLLLCAICHVAQAEDWPGWRGPRGDGSSTETTVPETWNGATGENVLWKTTIPGEGHGSPAVSGDRVYLVSCLVESLERVLVCVDRLTGKIVWKKTVVRCPLEVKHQLNSYA